MQNHDNPDCGNIVSLIRACLSSKGLAGFQSTSVPGRSCRRRLQLEDSVRLITSLHEICYTARRPYPEIVYGSVFIQQHAATSSPRMRCTVSCCLDNSSRCSSESWARPDTRRILVQYYLHISRELIVFLSCCLPSWYQHPRQVAVKASIIKAQCPHPSAKTFRRMDITIS